jgi:hypothetical protein
MSSSASNAADLCTWRLLYTKPHADAWVEANLRNQGFESLLPRIATRTGFGPLFPRYLFAGYRAGQRAEAFAGTYGVQYVVHCGAKPAIVPLALIEEIRGRMNANGVVVVDAKVGEDPLFARGQRERLETLAKLAAAGFRVRAA